MRTLLSCLACLGLAMIAGTSSAQELAPADPALVALLHEETTAHVGESLPSGVMVHDDNGKAIDLRQALSGPITLFKLKPDCKPCHRILGMLREPDSLQRSGDIGIVVLMVNSGKSTLLDLPTTVASFHTGDSLDAEGFLAGQITPTTFYFDQTLKLIKRKPGLPFSARTLLEFPTTP